MNTLTALGLNPVSPQLDNSKEEVDRPNRKRLHSGTETDEKVKKSRNSLYCTETLDNYVEPLAIAGASASLAPHKGIPPFAAFAMSVRPSFTTKLIINLLNQVKISNIREWRWIERQKLPDFFTASITIISRSFKPNEKALSRLNAFNTGIETLVRVCGDEAKFRKIRNTALRMIATMHTSVNALRIHQEVLSHYTPASLKPETDMVDFLFEGVPKLCRPSIVTEIGHLWDISRQASGELDEYILPNLPNQLFKVTVNGEDEAITFFRMQSPEKSPQELSPLYTLFLNHHHTQSSKHMSLIMLSPSIFEQEQTIANLRYRAQEKYKHSLFAWAFEPDTDFAAQDAFDVKDEEIVPFMETLDEYLLKGEKASFDIPDTVRREPAFEDAVEDAILEVKRILFPSHQVLSPDEKRDFILMTVVLLLEEFCEMHQPSTVDTACRSHIDRGIMISSVFYVYLLIKSGNHSNAAFLDYLKPFMLAPALTVAQRPPHIEKMRAALSLITRMLHPVAVKNIQKTHTFFSKCSLEIPKTQ